jgi:subtilisin family serine protease
MSDVAAGITYAANYPGVKVINLSIGPGGAAAAFTWLRASGRI